MLFALLTGCIAGLFYRHSCF